MIMSAADLLAKNANPSEDEIRDWLKGNICRCTGYHNIVKAVQIGSGPDGLLHLRSRLSCREKSAMSSTTGIGAAVKRREDFRFIKGLGKYTDDLNLPGQLYMYVLRSPLAHAKINGIDTSQAKSAPGVAAVFTGADIDASGAGGMPCGWLVTGRDGSPMKEPKHPILATGKVRHVGDPVAAVIAETYTQARDAAELIMLDLEELPAVIDMKKALTRRRRAAVHDEAPDNLCFDWELGDKAATDAAFARAAHVTKLDLINNRLVPNAMEPRAGIGHYDLARDEYTLYTTSQNPHVIRLLMGAFVLNIPEHKLRVIAPDVGGGFGSKIYHYAEEALVTWVSKRVNAPVKWVSDRSEAFMSDAHGRDHVTHAEMAFDADNKIIGLRADTLANMGAYLSTFAPVHSHMAAWHAAGRAIHHARDLHQCEGGVHQHRAGGRLSRRGPSRGHLHPGADRE